MHELVNQYIEKKKAEKRAAFEKTKTKTLIDLGLYEKEFPADPVKFDYNEYDSGFYDETAQTYKHFKKVPIEISDEEYEELLKYTYIEEQAENNTVSKALQYIAVSIYVVGTIAGFIYVEYAFVMTILVWLAAFVSGTIMLGFSEIVKLLHEIKNKIQ